MKIVTVVGARPQFIKAATLSRLVKKKDDITEVLVHTGQHFDANMSEIFFEELQIPIPGYNLGINSAGHGAMTGRQLEAIEDILLDENPDYVLVYGDTNSTLAATLAAVKLHVPVAHVEAGLRSFNRRMPEEINRVLTDHAATQLYAPTEAAIQNLRNEGLHVERMSLVGDVMYDASLYYRGLARQPTWFKDLPVTSHEFVLATLHRAENADNPARLRAILDGLSELGQQVILPVHPRTRRRIADSQITVSTNVHYVDPVGYLEMIWLENNCTVIATDSGGVQKEAYFFGKPCVTFRDKTEWVELVQSGWNVLVDCDVEKIISEITKARRPDIDIQLYGSGNAAEGILNLLVAEQASERGW